MATLDFPLTEIVEQTTEINLTPGGDQESSIASSGEGC